MTEIQKVKAEIKMLEKKLSFLEELEKTKSPVEEAYKDWCGDYPSGTSSNASQWVTFQAGYNAAYEEKVSEEPEENEWKLVALRLGEKLSDNGPGGYYDFTPGEWFEWALNECKEEEPEEQKWDVVRESLKWHKEHPNESVEDYLTPKTPEKRKIDDLAEKLLPDDHPYKIADEHGETNPYKQYLNSVKEWKPSAQTPEQKFKEIPELLDQLDALSEFHPLPTVVWRDIRKLMFLSYDKGYSKGEYDTHMKYAGTD